MFVIKFGSNLAKSLLIIKPKFNKFKLKFIKSQQFAYMKYELLAIFQTFLYILC